MFGEDAVFGVFVERRLTGMGETRRDDCGGDAVDRIGGQGHGLGVAPRIVRLCEILGEELQYIVT